jgi:ATP-binding cassette subfamily B protein/subfamily B ATP-binding cassette protein MsbA
MKNLLRALRYFRPERRLIAGALVFMLLATGTSLMKPWPLAWIVDSILQDQPLPGVLDSWLGDLEPEWILAILGGLVLLVHTAHGALTGIQKYLVIVTGLRGLARVRNQLYQWLQRLSLRYFQGSNQGDVIYRATWDTYSFQTLFEHGLFTFLGATVLMVCMGTVMWRLNVPLTLVALATVPLLLVVMKHFGRRMRQRSLAAHQADSRVTSMVQQSIVALPLTQSYTREPDEARQYTARVAAALQHRKAQHGSEVLYLALVAVIFGLGTTGIIWLGARQVMAGALTLGELPTFISSLAQLYEPLNQLSHVGATVSDARAGTDRVFELLDTPEEVKETDQARPVRAVHSRENQPEETPQQTVWAKGNLAFEGVVFGYQKSRPVLRGINLEIAAGEKMAVIGPSGAGKSTLLHLVPRFFDPDEGALKLEGIDFRRLKLKDLRAQISLVFQEAILLPTSIAENIAYGKPDAGRAEIEAAAKAAHAEEFIRRLPNGFDTIVGEGAARLSMGEKQRINIARAFLKEAPILLLDEPTSALDAESEELVVAGLQNLMQGRTTLIAAHRLAVVRHADRIAVVEAGRLTEVGSPAELSRKKGYYSRLMESGAMRQ